VLTLLLSVCRKQKEPIFFVTLSLGPTHRPRERKVIIHCTQWRRDKRENQTLSNCVTSYKAHTSSPYVTRRHKSLNSPPLQARRHLWTTPNACLHNETGLCCNMENSEALTLRRDITDWIWNKFTWKKCYTRITIIIVVPAFRSQKKYTCNLNTQDKLYIGAIMASVFAVVFRFSPATTLLVIKAIRSTGRRHTSEVSRSVWHYCTTVHFLEFLVLSLSSHQILYAKYQLAVRPLPLR